MLIMTICSTIKTRSVMHKRKTKSFFRCGLDFVQDIFKTDYKNKQETTNFS